VSDVQPVTWLVIATVLTVVGLAVGWTFGRGGQKKPASRASTAQATAVVDDRATVRASALDSLGEAVLITDDNARVRDCNASALTLFNRHRGEVEEQFATSLRRFDGLDQSEPYKLAREHAVWVGEGWARQPDGGMKLCQVRVMAIRDARARVVAFAESFRDVAHDRNIEDDVRDLLYGVRTFEPSGSPSERLSSVRDELRVLSEGFRDLDHVLKQYERLLPSLGADDPLAESIAGAAHDARAAVAAVGVPALLEEIPRALARLRANLQSLPPDVMPADAPASEGTSREPTRRQS
jgi:hypothetical protein